MPPPPPAARRFAPPACVLAAAIALALSACGDGGSAAAENTTHAPSKSQATTRTALGQPGSACPAELGAFIDSLDRLRRQLAVGLSYEQYAARIKTLRAAYGRIPVDHLAIDCLTATGTPSEQAFNEYIDAANAWGECLADATCTTATIEPVLQRKWKTASSFLSEVR
jgi:hypothetical protein